MRGARSTGHGLRGSRRAAVLALAVLLAGPALSNAEEEEPTRPRSGESEAPAAATRPSRNEPEGEAQADQVAGAGYRLEAIEIRGNRRTRDSVILREVAFRPGEHLDLEDRRIDLSRYRLLATGYFADARLRLRRGSEPGAVVLVVDVVERGTLVVHDLALGVSELTPYGGFDIGEINFLGLGLELSGACMVSREQQAYRLRLGVPRFLDSPWAIYGELLYNDARDFLGEGAVAVEGSGEREPFATVRYSRLGGMLGTGVTIGHDTHVYLDYRLELIRALVPAAAAELGSTFGPGLGEPIEFSLMDGRSVLSALVLSLDHDTRDHPSMPSRGRRVNVSTQIASDALGSAYHYVKLTLLADLYIPLPWRHTLHLGLLAGTVFGHAPLFELYYVGDLSHLIPRRVQGLNFSHAPAPDIFSTSIREMRYEEMAGRLDVEYIVSLHRGRRFLYRLDFFFLIGIFALGSSRDFVSPPSGYREGGAFPIDMTFDFGLRFDTEFGVFHLTLENLLRLIPYYEG